MIMAVLSWAGAGRPEPVSYRAQGSGEPGSVVDDGLREDRRAGRAVGPQEEDVAVAANEGLHRGGDDRVPEPAAHDLDDERPRQAALEHVERREGGAGEGRAGRALDDPRSTRDDERDARGPVGRLRR